MEIKNSLTPTPAAQPQQALPRKTSSPLEGEAGFGQELQQAGAMAVSSSAPVVFATPAQGGGFGQPAGEGAQGKSPEYSALGQKGIQPQQFGLREGPASAERKPETQGAAASMNAATAMSGLKPWSKDWVFTGQDQNPQLTPLLGGGEGIDPEALAKLAARIQAPQQAGEAAGTRGIAQGSGARQPGASFAAESSGEVSVQNQQQQAVPAAQEPFGLFAGAEILGARAIGDGEGEEGMAPAPGQKKAAQGQGQKLNSELSGADFLGTLGVAQASGRGERSGLGEQSQQQGEGRKPQLKMIDGGAIAGRKFDPSQFDLAQSGVAGAQVMNFKPDAQLAGAPKLAPVVTGHVVKGAMSQDRLSSESLVGMTSGISSLRAQGGGEMKVRLRPEGLGEMSVRVLTRGNDVRLQIKASDEGAKKIIEESMVHLKDRLSAQNLTLARVELSVGQLAQPQQQGQAQDGSQQFQQNQAYQQQDLMGQQQNQGMQQGQGGGNSDRWSEGGGNSGFGRSGAQAQSARAALQAMGSAGSARRAAYSETGRLDVTA